MDIIAMQYPTFQPSYIPLTWVYNFAQSASPHQMNSAYICGNAAAQISGQITCLSSLNSPFVPPSTQPAPTNETSTDNSSNTQSNGMSTGAKAGIAIGVIAGVAALGGAGFWFWRRNRGGEPSHNFYKMDDI
jgi:LPXTG-motif cell wall-anchored protein